MLRLSPRRLFPRNLTTLPPFLHPDDRRCATNGFHCPARFRANAWWIPLTPILGATFCVCVAQGLIWRSVQGPGLSTGVHPGAFLHSLAAWIAFDGTPLTHQALDLALTAGLTEKLVSTARSTARADPHDIICACMCWPNLSIGLSGELDWAWPRFFGLFECV